MHQVWHKPEEMVQRVLVELYLMSLVRNATLIILSQNCNTVVNL